MLIRFGSNFSAARNTCSVIRMMTSGFSFSKISILLTTIPHEIDVVMQETTLAPGQYPGAGFAITRQPGHLRLATGSGAHQLR
ncbi:hypothetical protein [Andreprevotia sp. IGB-42]|uniref:hypothetical protein n=1 Tax=Andreprevotia sp. IGB-42 TaxID=2497473 RepID=UPI001356AEA2|nr:hypothetical protein [Andreprevotia sp. IGB-42]